MATRSLSASIPNIRLVSGMQLKLEAISPTTGAAITGVTATHWAIYGDTDGESDDSVGGSGPYMLVPGPGAVPAGGAPVVIRGGL